MNIFQVFIKMTKQWLNVQFGALVNCNGVLKMVDKLQRTNIMRQYFYQMIAQEPKISEFQPNYLLSPTKSEGSNKRWCGETKGQYPELCLKFEKSLIDTCEGDSERRSNEIQDHQSDKQSVSISQFLLQKESDDDLCVQFHEHGHCLRGRSCQKIHLMNTSQIPKRKYGVIQWIIKETPQILLCKNIKISRFFS